MMDDTDRQPTANPTLPRPGFWQSLRTRLLALLGGMLLVTLLVIGASVFYFVSQNEQRTWQSRQEEAADHAGETVAGLVERVKDTLVLVGSLDRDTLMASPQVLPDLLEGNPALLELVRLDDEGQVLASAYRDEAVLANLFTIPQSIWFVQGQAGQLYLGDVQLAATGEPYAIMAVPAADGGVVAARLHMDLLWDVVAELRFGDTGQAYIIDQEGQIVAHPDPEVVLAKASLKGRPEMAAWLQAPGREWSGSYVNLSEVPVVGVIAPVRGTDWAVVTELSQAEAFSTSRTALLLLVGGLSLFGALVLWVTSRFLERLILQPMETLRAGATRIEQGDLAHRIEIARQDEVGQVAEAFNRMTNAIQQAREEQDAWGRQLEDKVRLRTRELGQMVEQQKQLLTMVRALSVPVIPVWERVVVLPLVGVVDSERAAQVVEDLLQGIESHRARVALVDITGVPVVDTHVAGMLVQAAQAGRLLGCQVVLVGIRPEVAHTLVDLGVNLGEITTYADLQSGVRYALRATG